jgi:hypothetical protein
MCESERHSLGMSHFIKHQQINIHTVKPGYKHIGYKHILTNKHTPISPVVFLVRHKHILTNKHMLIIGQSQTK